jgi:hypothetical protein
MGTMHMMEFINKYNLHYGLGQTCSAEWILSVFFPALLDFQQNKNLQIFN